MWEKSEEIHLKKWKENDYKLELEKRCKALQSRNKSEDILIISLYPTNSLDSHCNNIVGVRLSFHRGDSKL